jgi:F0F1-type ATP synthase assembly protein I
MIDFEEKLTQIRNWLFISLVVIVPITAFINVEMYTIPLSIIGFGFVGIVHTVRYIMRRYMKFREEKYSDVDYEEIVENLPE